MRSPKFLFTGQLIEKYATDKLLKDAWKAKIGKQLRKQLLIDLAEYRDFSHRLDKEVSDLKRELQSGSYKPCDSLRYLVEKSRGLCRQMTAPHPRDLLLLQVLSGALYAELRKNQPTNSAYFEPGEQKFNRFQLLYRDNEYGSIAAWKRFQKQILEFKSERKWLVISDIANFYDFISFQHLRNIVSSYCKVGEGLLDLLIYVLNELAWVPDYMPRSETGLPQIEAEAPRVLANAMLYELDKVAVKHSGGDYVRFMDDIDVGVDSIAHAKRVVRDIDLTLQSRQLRLNSSKTKILNFENGEVEDHFCLRENNFLDWISQRLQLKPTKVIHFRKAISKAYRLWKTGSDGSKFGKDCRFRRGNGSKIFKRIVTLSSHVRLELPTADLEDVIKLEPGLRDYAFLSLARNNHVTLSAIKIMGWFRDEYFVDDAAIVRFAGFLVHARLTGSRHFAAKAKELVRWCELNGSPAHLHAGFQIASKFLLTEEILQLAIRHFAEWDSSFWLARVVACNYPRFIGTANEVEFVQLLRSSKNQECASLLDYYFNLKDDPSFFRRELDYLKNENPTFPHKLIHSKALTLLVLRANRHATAEYRRILSLHSVLLSDPTYHGWFR